MPSTKISDMTSAVSIGDTDVVPIVQSATNKKTAWSLFKSTLKTYFDTLYQNILTAANFGDFVVGLTGKTTPVDADTIPLSDSAASDDAKKVTWANVKATLKTYFDTLYSPSSYAAIPRLSKTTLSAAHTGTTANTYVDGLLIPANTYGAGTVFEVLSRVNKTTSVGTYTHRIYVNTANSLAGSPILIATAATSAAANRFQQITRQVEIMVANGTGAGTEVMTATTGSTQDDVQQTDMTTCAIDWTVNQYIVCAIQLASGTDSINNHFIITR